MDTNDKDLDFFLKIVDDKKNKASKVSRTEMVVIEKKRNELLPIRELLEKFKKVGLVVADSGVDKKSTHKTHSFDFYESESSPSWGPGISLYFDHPVEVEISIPNDRDKEKFGLVVISVVSDHKDKNLLSQKFKTIDQAKMALVQFLGKNVISVENDPRKKPRRKGPEPVEPSEAAEAAEAGAGPEPVMESNPQNAENSGAIGSETETG